MAKQNKVAVNLAQDFTDTEKAQARANIGTSQISYDNAVTDMSVTKEIVRPWMNTKYTATIGNDNFLLLPTVYQDGMVVKHNGSLETQSIPQGLPDGGSSGQALFLDSNGDPIWATVPSYYAGNGISMYLDAIGDTRVDWEYTVGRNLHINQNNQIQTDIPGGLYDAPASQSNLFADLTDASGNTAKFAGAYRLTCRHNPNDTYELALKYTASGMTGTITFTGTETVIMTNNSMGIHPAAYISEYAYYTPSRRFGADFGSTIFDPSVHKAIIYQGLAQIGPTSNTQIAIWQDNGAIKISFTSIEVGRVGSTL